MNRQKSFANDQEGIGKLYVVGTPIGNLNEMSPRAIDVLKTVDLIAAEDTRHTRKLLSYFEFSTPLISLHEHNEVSKTEDIVQQLLAGKSVAVVSDAGMPAISDPGEVLVDAALKAGISVIPVSGPNAAINALVASGIAAQPFTFIGFLPRQKKERQKELQRWSKMPTTLIFYEAPHRVKQMLHDCAAILGDRKAAVARELTKKHEEWLRGTIAEIINYLEGAEILGEYCVVIEGSTDNEDDTHNNWWNDLEVVQHVQHYIEGGMDKKSAIRQVANDRGVPKREIYQIYHEH
ncbi:16S rRNA (cytidine(1402)-2'-O)-methyltransferase [Shimazuella sp. AN120528]|uniref:16S rRNA (cytidine(1402)-2'-O)-methyltransferase n=1 Tax=Shimazuella soli TaxID=1892854 RepID=UPI001F0DFA8F|nr:16S rRNA (cytidine(1402)-2'-O)-methyltransferase [Shimazuella soli]MCH5585832.1 16S rRNA (cytidine(1402)-2'-O)-methyltransferase [Shimazuella soli]